MSPSDPCPIAWPTIREQFLLDEQQIYLNAGTLSAMPRTVLDAVVRHLRHEEANPTRHVSLRWQGDAWQALHVALADYLGATAEGLILHVNATEALNQALFGFPWQAGDELLVGHMEYGAIVNAGREAVRRAGGSLRTLTLPEHGVDDAAMVQAVLDGLSPQTRAVLLSHVTTRTGHVLPVAAIARALAEKGVALIVDGAHGPGLLPLQLADSAIAFYGGNLHKWFMGPKATAFLFVHEDWRSRLQPSIVGWGNVPVDGARHVPGAEISPGTFFDVFQLQGIRSRAYFFALQEVLAFRRQLGERQIHERVADLRQLVRQRLTGELGLVCLSPPGSLSAGLISFTLPAGINPTGLQETLFHRHRITVAAWEEKPGQAHLRISPHIWNLESDIDHLVVALRVELG